MADIESSYSILTAALVTRLRQRQAIATATTNVLDYIPVNRDDLRTPVGTNEVIAMAEGDGVFEDVVFCDGSLRFDETLLITILIEVHGTDSLDTQPVVKRRVNELVYELFADIAVQQSWDKAALGLDIFDYLWFTPATQRWTPGRLQQTGVFAAACEIGLEARSRRSFA